MHVFIYLCVCVFIYGNAMGSFVDGANQAKGSTKKPSVTI